MIINTWNVSGWLCKTLCFYPMSHFSFHEHFLIGILINDRRRCLTWWLTIFENLSFKSYITELNFSLIQSFSIFSNCIFNGLIWILEWSFLVLRNCFFLTYLFTIHSTFVTYRHFIHVFFLLLKSWFCLNFRNLLRLIFKFYWSKKFLYFISLRVGTVFPLLFFSWYF